MEVTTTKCQIIKGKPVADKISENLIKEVDELVKEGIKICDEVYAKVEKALVK